MPRPPRKGLQDTFRRNDKPKFNNILRESTRRGHSGVSMTRAGVAETQVTNDATATARLRTMRQGGITKDAAKAYVSNAKMAMPLRVKPAKETPKFVSTRPLLGKRTLDLEASRERLKIQRLLEHPLSKGFDDTTASYSEELIEAANYVLDEQHNKLVSRLNGKYDGDDTLQASRLLQDAIETATSEVKPLSEETITITNKQKDTGARTEQTYTLDQRVTQFKVTIRAEEAKVVKLSKEYDALLRSIAVFMANKLEPGLEPASGTNREKIQEWREEIEAEIGELGEEELQELKDERKSDRQNLKKLKVLLDAF